MSPDLIALIVGVPVLLTVLSIRPILLNHSIQLSDDRVASLPPFLSALLEKRLRAFVRREGCTLTADSRIQRRLDLFAALKYPTPEEQKPTQLGRTETPENLKEDHDVRA